jgi:hypothetical protein
VKITLIEEYDISITVRLLKEGGKDAEDILAMS